VVGVRVEAQIRTTAVSAMEATAASAAAVGVGSGEQRNGVRMGSEGLVARVG
jgi:hypothetical protein